MKTNRRLPALLIGLSLASVSQAGVITYEATNYDHGMGNHSLWTNRDYPGERDFTSTDSLQLTHFDNNTADVSDDTLRLTGMTISNKGEAADIDLLYTGAVTELDFKRDRYFQGGGLSYSDILQHSPLFFREVLGTITVGQKVYDIDSNVTKRDGSAHVTQLGMGANAKNRSEFGLSAWVRTCQRNENAPGASACMGSTHWDINLALTPVKPDVVDVPEPGVLGLLAAGVAGLVVSRRRVRQA